MSLLWPGSAASLRWRRTGGGEQEVFVVFDMDLSLKQTMWDMAFFQGEVHVNRIFRSLTLTGFVSGSCKIFYSWQIVTRFSIQLFQEYLTSRDEKAQLI
jgi:hypothetical protein